MEITIVDKVAQKVLEWLMAALRWEEHCVIATDNHLLSTDGVSLHVAQNINVLPDNRQYAIDTVNPDTVYVYDAPSSTGEKAVKFFEMVRLLPASDKILIDGNRLQAALDGFDTHRMNIIELELLEMDAIHGNVQMLRITSPVISERMVVIAGLNREECLAHGDEREWNKP